MGQVIALRVLVRYAVPIAIASAIVTAPLFLIAFRAPWPVNLKMANAAGFRGFALAACGFVPTLLLVAAIAPLVRSVAANAPLSQVQAIRASLANLVRMALPCFAAIGAIVVGGLALVLPALFLVVLFSLTGASTERGMPAPLVESAAVVRRQWRVIAVIVVGMLVVHVAIALSAWKFGTVPIAKKLKPEQWATYGNIARVVAIGLFASCPVFATLLASRK